MLRYIRSYSSFYYKTIMILNQGNIWACASVSMLGALKRMKPEIDHESLLKEVLADKSCHFTYQRASAWFVRKWLIKWIRRCTYSPFLLKKQPILTGLVNVDWKLTGSSPYALKFEDREILGSHFVHIVELWKIANSYGSEWGDHWYFYFEQSQVKRMKQMFAIVL